MNIVFFVHSLVSDWNHGNAHFLRGVVRELMNRGHQVDVYEPKDAWSRVNLVEQEGPDAEGAFHDAFPSLRSEVFDPETIDLEAVFDAADIVIVHEWNEPGFIAAIGRHAQRFPEVRLYFHDTHHRAASAPGEMASLDLAGYTGVLAFGRVIRDLYLANGWAHRAWVWHEAADAEIFRPLPHVSPAADVVWIGNWGDEERTNELEEFLLEPARVLQLSGTIYGVRYPEEALERVAAAGLSYRGWIANHQVPEAFARHRLTVHVPRRPYVEKLPGIPTIRVFEALACGIPLVTAPWDDAERLFEPERDYLVARDGSEMQRLVKELLHEPELAAELGRHGRRTILDRHTCGHRADELISIYEEGP